MYAQVDQGGTYTDSVCCHANVSEFDESHYFDFLIVMCVGTKCNIM